MYWFAKNFNYKYYMEYNGQENSMVLFIETTTDGRKKETLSLVKGRWTIEAERACNFKP